MSENSIGLKTQVLAGLLEETFGQRYYAILGGVQKDFKQIGFLDITGVVVRDHQRLRAA